MDVWLHKVPTRQANMQPYEILLSESQERMLVVVKKGEEEKAKAVFAKWDIHCAEIGVVTEGGTLRYFYNEEIVAQVPAESLVLGGGAPVYERSYREPEYIREAAAFHPDQVPVPKDLKQVAADLLNLPNLASKAWITEQYDSMVGTATLTTNLPSDAAVINLKGTERALGMTVDCNPRYVYAHPEIGTAIAVAESARNLVCSGAKPLGVTNCLNFGNPYNPEVYWQFVGAIKGMSAACKAFNTPVTGGNVSFYNQYTEQGNTLPVFPTPTIGMVGLVHNKKNIKGLNFKSSGDCIMLVGKASDDICSSEYLNGWHNITQSPPPAFSLDDETALCATLEQALETLPIYSVHDCADGGLWLALLEKSIPGGFGFSIHLPEAFRPDGFLFGEAQGRVVITCPKNSAEDVAKWFTKQGLENSMLGEVTSGEILVQDTSWGSINDFHEIWKKGLSQYLPSEG
jgi:phosphoribosylformylglycinamidine synthase